MLFTLKKFVGGLLMPLPLVLIIMALALILLWFTRWQKSGKTLFALSWLILLLISLQPVADRLLLPLEKQYATYQGNDPVDYIVVLGGGYTFNPNWAPSANLFANSLPRVTEGIRLYRAHPNAKLVFTGGAAPHNQSSAKTAAQVAESLGVPAEDIIALDQPKDTIEEAAAVANLVGDKPFLLVTSANHLPRAMNFFVAKGLNPIPAPANQLAITTPLQSWERAIPAAVYLGHSERAWYETLGLMWQKLTANKNDE
ncbi:membrane protein functionally coupled to the MukBEF chromosome partitioning mechanism [Yersinia rohdei]|uniref:Envelope biogenesis factor ElyC n=1 Tax=Yersinia rohdei TaxID=29485 RepID=A0A0U1HN33_YERRO|nr:envelope biogenesis factor ElyC [Yersinia rohdei]MDN0095865.1 envelope biogenesis factor ElyC [Yersinia rohdei]OWF81014.1 envelope biogenesis factor ElyC [Yersinia rohdei]CNE19199.1 membrane protein functionally coupled to the MukBEF chromosome partitioning mechanism [Yersinia rohdei]CNI54428.1 membrane protein functionally coupled to the MukBEF chromosome partitioning mechanism [Yersinia rohdei]CQI87868.1 membrane protein functionally coupled to the MukBEF chromosome partitioning mechanism